VTQTQEKSPDYAGTGNHKTAPSKHIADLDIANLEPVPLREARRRARDFVKNNGIEEQRNKEKGQLESLSEGNCPSEESTACDRKSLI
jgi:hypothetical protein